MEIHSYFCDCCQDEFRYTAPAANPLGGLGVKIVWNCDIKFSKSTDKMICKRCVDKFTHAIKTILAPLQKEPECSKPPSN